jgi:heme exporter protein D
MHDFFHMGGYALYVWSTYGLALIVLVLNIIIPLRREKKLLKSIAVKTKRKNSS